MTEENIKSEESLGNAQAVVPDEPVTEVPAEEIPVVDVPAEEVPAAEVPAEKVSATEAVEETPAFEGQPEEKKEKKPEEKKEGQPEEKKEKKPGKAVTYFANAKSGGDLVKKCFLLFLLALVLAYVGLLFWGLLDKYIPTFYNGAYWAVGTAAAFLLIGIVLIFVIIARFVRQNKKKK